MFCILPLEVLAETDSGMVVGSARARLAPNGRAVVAVPVDGLERPATVFVRLRADGESIVERADITPEPAALIGDPQAQRSSRRGLAVPVALFEFVRLPLAEDPAAHAVVVEMSLSGLPRGDYLIELTAGAGSVTERRLVALRIK